MECKHKKTCGNDYCNLDECPEFELKSEIIDQLEINNYVDFNRLFKDLFEQQKDSLIEYKHEVEHCQKILYFIENMKIEFELMLSECELNDNEILFSFGHFGNDANESNTQSSYARVDITFDISVDEFSEYYEEQG